MKNKDKWQSKAVKLTDISPSWRNSNISYLQKTVARGILNLSNIAKKSDSILTQDHHACRIHTF